MPRRPTKPKIGPKSYKKQISASAHQQKGTIKHYNADSSSLSSNNDNDDSNDDAPLKSASNVSEQPTGAAADVTDKDPSVPLIPERNENDVVAIVTKTKKTPKRRENTSKHQTDESQNQSEEIVHNAVVHKSIPEQNNMVEIVTKTQKPSKENKRKQIKPIKNSNGGGGVLNDIVNLQGNCNLIIPRLPFARMVRETLQNVPKENDHQNGGGGETTSTKRITVQALLALQESSELYLTQLMEDAYRITLHRKRVTLNPSDMQLTRYLRGRNDAGNR